MTGMIANLLLNIVIIGLLAATIGYCWILNRRIKILQDSKSELAQLLQHFDESTTRASESIIALQSASKKIGENIQHRIEKANYLIDDLSFMIERGSKLANQMEAGFAVSRARSRVIAEDKKPEEAEEIIRPATLSDHARHKPADKPAPKDKAVASLEAVLEKIVGRNKNNPEREEEHEARAKPSVKGRSKTEQELLEMLRVGIKG